LIKISCVYCWVIKCKIRNIIIFFWSFFFSIWGWACRWKRDCESMNLVHWLYLELVFPLRGGWRRNQRESSKGRSCCFGWVWVSASGRTGSGSPSLSQDNCSPLPFLSKFAAPAAGSTSYFLPRSPIKSPNLSLHSSY
jgi:hypothetical protein